MAWCRLRCPFFDCTDIIWHVPPKNEISSYGNNHPLVSQQVYGLSSCKLAHHLVLTCGNEACQKREKVMLVVVFWWVSRFFILPTIWPSSATHPLHWLQTPATPSCSFNLTTKTKSRTISHSSDEYCDFCIFANYLIGNDHPWPVIFCHPPSLWITNPTPHVMPSCGHVASI